MSKKNAEQLCVICGVKKATTKDHVPPKSIFAKPRPSDLVTIPACHSCNVSGSVADEEFGAFVAMATTIKNNGSDKKLFHQRVVKPLHHNKRLYRQIIDQSKAVTLVTPSGIIYDKAYQTHWNVEAHQKVMERTVRGLYFHHFSDILDKSTNFQIEAFETWPEEIINISKTLYQKSIGEEKLVYRFGKTMKNDYVATLWLFQFYQSHLVLVITNNDPEFNNN